MKGPGIFIKDGEEVFSGIYEEGIPYKDQEPEVVVIEEIKVIECEDY